MRAAVALVGGKRVKREQGRNDAHRLALAELAGELQQPQLALRIEAVAGLDLDRRAAAAHQRVQAAAALVEQLLVGRRGGALDRRGDAAAGLGNLLIARAGAAHRMLVGARAAEHEVRVAVDQARRDPGAAERDRLPWRESRRARCACRRGRSCRPRCRSRHFRSARADCPAAPRSVAMLQSTSSRSHMPVRLRRAALLAVKAMAGWPNLSDLVVGARRRDAPVGAGRRAARRRIGDARARATWRRRCFAQTLRRIGRYDVETGRELATQVARPRRCRDRRPVDRGSDAASSAKRSRRAPRRMR